MELTHTDFTEVTRVIFVKEGAVVVLTSGVTASSWVLAVFADTAVTHLDVAALLACFVEAGGHGLVCEVRLELEREKEEIEKVRWRRAKARRGDSGDMVLTNP